MTHRVTITKSFVFSAAHYFSTMPEGHRYRRIHGHSFGVELALTGEPDPEHGWLQDFDEFAAAVDAVRETLDHTCLNDIAGLEQPSLENLSIWIWQQLKEPLPALSRVTVRRDASGEGCTYEGPDGA
ncbi:MAG: 6-carboxytetrahydropterin synthase [Proteobacteria bacterium]|nr:6-carboxytetrahydropterin synthase [Pseudomonadota bacterium]